MNQSERAEYLIKRLLDEDSRFNISIPKSFEDKKILLRGLFNIREPRKIDEEFLKIQNEYLQRELQKKGITYLENLNEIEPGIYLWRGDITTLKVDAIVNAANNRLLGCFAPNHICIDNEIHTFSGIQLRLYCNEIMKKQNHLEETGLAKITEAYNLPSSYVIHTVGPIVNGELTDEDKKLLKSCYISCLEIAEENNLKSIAFCCISTGEFRFPNDIAGKIAVDTVRNYLREKNSNMKVIFNVFKETDERIYKRLLG